VQHINDLREMLGEIILAVKNGDLDVERAKAIKGLADSVIDTAKVETDYCRVTGALGTGFVEGNITDRVSGPSPLDGMSPTRIQHSGGAVREITTMPGVTRTINRAK
jgi:hypothetical protein